jgi:DNA-binding transcriptional MerR regulator
MSSYRISQLAERSGVPATTLRFYETAGLLSAERTASGYRSYDETAVERLAFISSAKLLGLGLEDIGALLEVWDGGACAAVRDQMLPLVEERIVDADRRVAELRAFSASLTRAKTELTKPAPAGGCGADCGCITTTGDQPAVSNAVPLALSRTRSAVVNTSEPSWRDTPIACTLTPDRAGVRTSQWRDLLTQCRTREQVPDGFELTFPHSEQLAAEVAALAAAEQQCCTFFDFALHLSPSALVLTVRAPQSAAALLTDLFGAAV